MTNTRKEELLGLLETMEKELGLERNDGQLVLDNSTTWFDINHYSHNDRYMKKMSKFTYVSSNGYTFNVLTRKKSKGNMNAWGYMTISYQGTTTTINNLIYRLFVGNIPENFVIHHINHNKEDNRLSNLACISRADNLRERFVNNPNLGREMFSNKNSNYIYCESNHTLYQNKTTLAKDLNLLISACDRVLDGTWKQYKGYKFQYLTDDQMEDLKKYEKEHDFNFFNKRTKKVKLSHIQL